MRYVVAGLLVAFITSTASTASAAPPAQRANARAAWDTLNSGRIQEAADAFAEALKSRPQDASLLLGAGVAAHLQGRPDDARRWLFDTLKVDPALAPASLVLGTVLYGTGDIDGAIGVYEQALTHAPDNTQIARQLEAWRWEAALHRGFGQRLGDHFTVLFEGPAEAAFAESAVAVQTLLSQAGAPALVSLLGDIGRGEAFAAAFERNILVSYAEFQKKLQ